MERGLKKRAAPAAAPAGKAAPSKRRLAERIGANTAPIGGEARTSAAASATVQAGKVAPSKRRLAERIGANVAPIGSVSGASATSSAPPMPVLSGPMASGPTIGRQENRGGRAWTVSLALPGSIVDNAQTHELRSHLVGQLARALTIFNVDEIVIFSAEEAREQPVQGSAGPQRTEGSIFMARLLQYLECPQYLRKHIFPMHPDLRCVGLLAPLDATNHPRRDEDCPYREGIVAERAPKPGQGSWVSVGLAKEVLIDRQLPTGTRVTVRLGQKGKPGAAVSPREPRERCGLHWGYTVRMATSLPAVWAECPFEEGYDLSVGTSDKGDSGWQDPGFELAPFRHLLLFFGGVEGIEPLVAADPELVACDAAAASLFDSYLNLCPRQGSRTIRTEEALFVGLAALRPYIERAGS